MGAQSNKGGLGQRNLEEIEVASTLVHARSARGFRVFLALPLVHLARQSRQATQATVILILKFQKYLSCTVLLKAKKEDNKLEKQDRQI